MVRTRRRQSLAFALSAAAHAVTLLWGAFAFGPSIEIPEIDFQLTEVELIDPDALQGVLGQPEAVPSEPEPPPSEAVPEPDTKAQDDAKRKQEEEEAERKRLEEEKQQKEREEAERKRKQAEAKRKAQRENFAKEGTRADQLGPSTSTFHLLLVPKKIRALPFAQTAFSLLEPWPDFDFLVRKGGLDPLQDFDYIVIASPNITNALETFLAVQYKTSRGKIKKAIERAVAADGQVIEWIEDGGFLRGNPRPANPAKKDIDQRWFVFHPKKKVAMFVRDTFVDQILADSDAPVGEAGTARAFVDNLTKLQTFAESQPLSGMQLKLADLGNTISGVTLPFPTPDLIEATVEAANAPLMVVKLGFADVVQAKQFMLWYEEQLGAVMGTLEYRFIAKPIYDRIVVTRDEATLTLRTEFTQAQIELVLGALATQTKKMTARADAKRGATRKAGTPTIPANPEGSR